MWVGRGTAGSYSLLPCPAIISAENGRNRKMMGLGERWNFGREEELWTCGIGGGVSLALWLHLLLFIPGTRRKCLGKWSSGPAVGWELNLLGISRAKSQGLVEDPSRSWEASSFDSIWKTFLCPPSDPTWSGSTWSTCSTNEPRSEMKQNGERLPQSPGLGKWKI